MYSMTRQPPLSRIGGIGVNNESTKGRNDEKYGFVILALHYIVRFLFILFCVKL